MISTECKSLLNTTCSCNFAGQMGANASKWTTFGQRSGKITRICPLFHRMKHPGVYFTGLWLALMPLGYCLVQALKVESGQAGGYVCPPCGCPMHDKVFEFPGKCSHCKMPLVSVNRKHNEVWEAIFFRREVAYIHHKFFYPVNFLALFIGLFGLYRYRREIQMVLFLVFFLSLALYSFKHQLYSSSYSMNASERWAFFPLSFLLAAGPALYLYFSSLKKSGRVFSRQDWLHFLPALLVFLVEALLFIVPEAWRDFAIFNNYDHYPGLSEQITFLASGTYYCFCIKNLGNNDAGVSRWQLGFPVFLMTVAGVLAIMVAGNLYFSDLMSTWLDYHPVWLVIAVFSLWSTYLLVFKKEVLYQKEVRKENRLTDPKLAAWKAETETVMQTRKPYLNPDLSLQTLAQMIGIKEKDLSEVLNIGFSKSFHDYVNQYRIEEVKKMLLDPGKRHLTNFALAQEAGFNSKSAFFGLFKKHVGMTPGEFKQKAPKG